MIRICKMAALMNNEAICSRKWKSSEIYTRGGGDLLLWGIKKSNHNYKNWHHPKFHKQLLLRVSNSLLAKFYLSFHRMWSELIVTVNRNHIPQLKISTRFLQEKVPPILYCAEIHIKLDFKKNINNSSK